MNIKQLQAIPTIVFSLAVVLLLQSCAVNPVTGKRQLMLLSKNQEQALGAASDPGIVATYGQYDDPKLQQFINAKGRMMGRISHLPKQKYEFKILDSPVVNAFALPGGYVYFTRGIMAHFNNEAEFAGVLGHEIGHITARHSAEQYSKQILAQVGLMAGMVLSEDFRKYANLANTGVGLLFLKFGRDNESQSDELGVEYSTKIGYDAQEMAGFFSTLKRLSDQGGGGGIPTFLSTHPDPADREKKVGEMAREQQRKARGRQFKVNRESYLRRIDGLVYGEDPRQGYFENNNFYHPELKFQFPVPSAWQTVNMPAQVQMAPKDGKALMMLSLSAEKSLPRAADAFLQQFQLQQTGRQDKQVNGLPATVIQAQQVDQQTQQIIKVMAYLIKHNGKVYQLLGMAYDQDFRTYSSRFQTTMEGFKKLTDASKINVRPERIKIVQLDKASSLQEVLSTNGIPSSRYEELAILNGMQLNTQLRKGELIKVVEKKK
jgi:predicted Zn-dependent protease